MAMYRPTAFDMTDQADIADFIDAAGPAHLVSLGSAGLIASVVPLILDRSTNSLVGHLARPNPQWSDRDDSAEAVDALAIFAGVDAYVSPSFYPSKRETQRVVPTWNYDVVHAHGRLVVHDDAEWVTALLTRLTELHEGRRSEQWSVDDTPAGYIAAMVKGIVGIELQITRLEGKRKLSQNRSEADVDGVIEALASGTVAERETAAAMQRAARR